MADVVEQIRSSLSGESQTLDTPEKYNKKLLEHVEKLRSAAVKNQPTALLGKIDRYYRGSFDPNTDKVTNQRNVIKNIGETKVTLLLDAQMTTTVVPRLKSFSDMPSVVAMFDVADVLDECLKQVLKTNKLDKFSKNVVRNGVKKIGIAETVWNPDAGNGLGDVEINSISPKNFFPDGSANDVPDMNYCFIRQHMSPITLKAKYPEFAEKIDKVGVEKPTEASDKTGQKPKGVINYQTPAAAGQSYAYEDPQYIMKNSKDLVVWKLYLKDDSTMVAEEVSTKSAADKEALQEMRMKYPNGRCIIYLEGAKDFTFEDKAIDYPFGFPIDIFVDVEGDTIWEAQGCVEDLFENQDRINRAYSKVKELVAKYVSFIVNNSASGLSKGDFVNKTVIEIDNSNYAPTVLTNNTLGELEALLKYLDMLKQDTYDISKLNPQVISGERQQGVTSGQMVEALNESPMTAIGLLQKNFKDFIISVSQKAVVLVQLYYTVPRIVRIAEGDKFIKIPTRQTPEQPQPAPAAAGQPAQPAQAPMAQQPIEVYQRQTDEKGTVTFEAVKQIKADLSIGEYDVEVIAGTEMPRSRTERAQLTMSLFEKGLLGKGAEAIEEVLRDLDVPNRRAIVERVRKEAEAANKFNPAAMPNIAQIFTALEGFTQAKRDILKNVGLNDKPDTAKDAPVQEIEKAGLDVVAAIVPEKIGAPAVAVSAQNSTLQPTPMM